MKIAVIAPEFFPVPPIRGGAVETIIEEVTRHFAGHEIYIYGVSDPELPFFERKESRFYFRYRQSILARLMLSSWRLPFKQSGSPLYYLPYRRWLEKQLRKLKPDVIWLHSRIHFAPALKKAVPSAKLILSLHNESNLKDKAVWSPAALSCCDLVTACSKSLGEKAALEYPALRPKLRTLYNGADLLHFSQRKGRGVDPADFRKTMGFAPYQPLICFAGRLVRDKGPHVLIEAFHKVLANIPDAGLCIIGAHTFSDDRETPYIRDLKKAAEGLENSIRFIGHVPREKMPLYFNACNVFAFPSLWDEPFGMSLVEAMACHLPCVAFQAGGPIEIIEQEKTGVLVPRERGSRGFAEALIRILKAPDTAFEMGNAARGSVERRFSWERIAGDFLDFCSEEVRGTPNPPLRAASRKFSDDRPVVSATPTKRNVLIAESGSGFGGTARYLRDLVNEIKLNDAGLLIAAYHQGPFIEAVARDGHQVFFKPSWRYPGPVDKDGKTGSFLLFLKACAHLIRTPSIAMWLKNKKVKVVHLNNEVLSHLPLIAASKMAGCRVLCHLHGWRPFTKTERFMLRFVDELAAISNAGARYYSEQLKGRAVIAVPNGISLNNGLDDLPAKRGKLRSTLGIFENEKVFLLAARLVPWKGQDVFLKALARVVEKYPFVMGLIAGHDPSEGQGYTRELHDIVKRSGIERNVFFLPFQEDAWSLYAASDFVVHASKRPEPFGLVILEAMAASKPVIATEGGGVGDIVEDGESGYLVPPGDDEALASRMEMLLSRPDVSADFAHKGRIRLRSLFSIQNNAKQINAIYLRLLSKGGKR